MGIACIVEGGPAYHFKGERSSHYRDGAYDMVLELGTADRFDRHKIDDLTDPVNSQETCDKDIGFRYIELFMPHAGRIKRCNAEVPAFVGVEYGSKDTGGIKT